MKPDIPTLMFFFEGTIPSKKNSRFVATKGRRVINIPSEKHRAWHKQFFPLVLKKRPDRPLEQVAISFYFAFPDNKRRDTDNAETSILDLLVDASIIKDDNWKVVREKHSYSRLAAEDEEAGCQVFITSL